MQADNPANRILYTDKGTGNGDAMNRTRFKLDQNRAPIHEALENFRRMRVVPFDVPGHKRGRGNPELTEFLGQKCVGVDPGGRRTGSRCLWSSSRLSHGWRNYKLRTDHGVNSL